MSKITRRHLLSGSAAVAIMASSKVSYSFILGGPPPSSPFIQAHGSDLYYQNNRVMLRGVNQNNSYAGDNRNELYFPGDGTEGTGNPLDVDMTETDYIVLSGFGCNHVRFGLWYGWYKNHLTDFWAMMDQQITWARQNNMWILPVMFTTPGNLADGAGAGGCYEGYNRTCPMWTSSTLKQQLVDFWVAFATRYVNEPVICGLDLLNEPNPPDTSEEWYTFAQTIINAVRTVNTKVAIFVEANINAIYTHTFTDPSGNIVYSPHDYNPGDGTHMDTNVSPPGDLEVYNNPSVRVPTPGLTGENHWPGYFRDYDGVDYFFSKDSWKSTNGLSGTALNNIWTRLPYKWCTDNNVPLHIGEWGSVNRWPDMISYLTDKIDLYNNYYFSGKGLNHSYFLWREYYNFFASTFALTASQRDGSGRLTAVLPPGPLPSGPLQQQRWDLLTQNAWNASLASFAAPMSPGVVIAPVISGSLLVGRVLSVTHDGIYRGFPKPTATHQWQRDNQGGGVFVNITGATSTTYTQVTADINCQMRREVVASNASGTATAHATIPGQVVDPAWVPANLSSGVLAVFDAVNPSNVTVASGRVTQFADTGGGSHHLTPRGTGVLAPTYSATSFSGTPGLSFIGTDGSNLRTASLPLGGSVLYVFLSVIPPTLGTSAVFSERIASFVATGDAADFSSSGSAVLIYRQGQNDTFQSYKAPDGILSTAAISGGVVNRLYSGFNGTNQRLGVNNVPVTPVAYSAAFGANGQLVVASDGPEAGTEAGTFTVQRILVMTRVPTTIELSQIDGWLRLPTI